jgi:DTW domain-containing protein YfiP
MDIQQYLEKKKNELAAQAAQPQRQYCRHCLKSVKACFCHEIEPLDTLMHFVLLMHPKEAFRETVGTGRISQLALKNSRLIIGTEFNQNAETNSLLTSPRHLPFLLYPGRNALNISTTFGREQFLGLMGANPEKIPTVFVIDATWAISMKMRHKSKNLHDIPQICFTPATESKFVIKHQPQKHCLATIEAIFGLLDACDGTIEQLDGRQARLMAYFQRMIDFQLRCVETPGQPAYRHHHNHFKNPAERQSSRRWQRTRLFLDDKPQ